MDETDATPWVPGTSSALSRWRVRSAPAIGLVFLGGVAGVAAREGITVWWPLGGHSFPGPTLAINLVGAFLLGVLLEAVHRHGPDVGAGRAWRLLIGTGGLGGFTTYSALAVQSDLLVGQHDVASAVVYVVVSVAGGLGCAAAGISLAARRDPRSVSSLPVDPESDTLEEGR